MKHLKPKLSALLIILLTLSLFLSACGGGRGAEPGQSLNSQSSSLENSSSDLESSLSESPNTLESDESSEEALDGGSGKPNEIRGEKDDTVDSQNTKKSAATASPGKPTTTKRVKETEPAKPTKARPTAKETTTAKTTPTPPGGKLLGKLHLYIDAKNALPHIKGKPGYEKVPSNGIILDTQADLYEGDSVADILTRELDSRSIPHKLTQGNNYIKSLAGLAEKDCGPMSGWYYYVNGVSPPIGVGKYNQSMKPNPTTDLYPLKAGDKIAFYYTVNQRDVPGRQ